MIAAIPAAIQFDAARLLPYVQTSSLLLWGAGADEVWGDDPIQAEHWMTLGRLLLVPFAVLGLIATELLAKSIGGHACKPLAGWLYVTSPLLLTANHSIAADGVCASLICSLCVVLTWWAQKPIWRYALTAGVLFGLALLTKTLVLVLTPVFLAAAGLTRWSIHRREHGRNVCPSQADVSGQPPMDHQLPCGQTLTGNWKHTVAIPIAQGGAFLLIGLYVLQLGYLGRGLMIPLQDYSFVSETLSGSQVQRHADQKRREAFAENRFRGTLLGLVPVPLPAMYVYGIDRQKADMERSIPTFIAGRWRNGHWSDPLHVAFIKTPLGHTAVFFVAACLVAWSASRGYWPPQESLMALLPAVAIVGLNMSQTGMTIFARYLVPALPLIFALVSATLSNCELKRSKTELPQSCPPPDEALPRKRFSLRAAFNLIAGSAHANVPAKHQLQRMLFGLLVVVAAWEVCFSFPHMMAYQNLLVSSPREGSTYFLGVDEYGQNLWRIATWAQSLPAEESYFVSNIYCDRLVQIGHTQAQRLPGTQTLKELARRSAQVNSSAISSTIRLPQGWVVSTGPDRLGGYSDAPTWLRNKSVAFWLAPGLAVHHLREGESLELLSMLIQKSSNQSMP
jgi:hypothetical protein